MRSIIATVGLPGAGKSTVARAVGHALGVPVLSTGAALRSIAKSDQKLAIDLASGSLGPEDLVRRIVDEFLAKNENAVLDGYPRHAAQANCLLTRSARLVVVHLFVSENSALERIRHRPPRGDENLSAVSVRFRREAAAVQEILSILSGHVLQCDARDDPASIVRQVLSEFKKLAQT